MLNDTNKRGDNPATATIQSDMKTTSESKDRERSPGAQPGLIARALRIEWLGQMVASLCWIVSVFSYGISSTGDWLQLAAASAWFVANVAAIATPESD